MWKNVLVIINILLLLLAISGVVVTSFMLFIGTKREWLMRRSYAELSEKNQITLKRARLADFVFLLVHLCLVYVNFYAFFTALPELPHTAIVFYYKTLIFRAIISILLQFLSIMDYYYRKRYQALGR